MKVEITVPSSLREITLEQYQKFAKVNTDENADTSFLMHKTVEVFCNLELKDIARIKFTYVKSVLETINELFDAKHELVPTFTMGGVEYGFIPALDDMTLGEYIDLDENYVDWETMHKAMAVLYRPVTFKKGHRYRIEDYNGTEHAERMKQTPLDVVMGTMVFFWSLNSELLQTTLNFLERETMEAETLELRQRLLESGDGIKASMELLKEMSPNLRMSLN